GRPISRLVMTPSALDPALAPEAVVMKARRLGLATSRLPAVDEGGDALCMSPVNVEDLLVRPAVAIDDRLLQRLVDAKSMIVAGGGGWIGGEMGDRIVTFGAARVLVIENSDPALHAVLEALATKRGNAKIEGRLADVRDLPRIARLMSDFKPDIVFHAA